MISGVHGMWPWQQPHLPKPARRRGRQGLVDFLWRNITRSVILGKKYLLWSFNVEMVTHVLTHGIHVVAQYCPHTCAAELEVCQVWRKADLSCFIPMRFNLSRFARVNGAYVWLLLACWICHSPSRTCLPAFCCLQCNIM